jgi:hypothetical protein
MTCEQCGRAGVRGFKVHPADDNLGTPELVVCQARTSCMRRAERNVPAEVRAERLWALECQA